MLAAQHLKISDVDQMVHDKFTIESEVRQKKTELKSLERYLSVFVVCISL